ncbi:MAG: adenylate/guanylate cyclase domain-containing protein [Mycobacterium sp.]|nr:adenylate/guanylate cyclase domain-containing protein [Mycobacterium sp.]
MTAGSLICVPCGSELGASDRFCAQCGAPASAPARAAELKQVTVLFADVVRSMDVAAVVGPERLRDIVARLLEVCAAVVRRYGGTLDKFTGDGIMAVFGAPKALEDHALRACLAALAIQSDVTVLREEVQRGDQVELQLRIGLNSGQVVAGDLGASTYTAIGDQVGRKPTRLPGTS